MQISDLEEDLRLLGIDYPVETISEYGSNEDLSDVARILGILPSELIKFRGDSQSTARAYLRELLPHSNDKLPTSMEKAWNLLCSSTQFKGTHPSQIKRQVQDFLFAQSRRSGPPACDFLDCPFRCITRCRKTGRRPGA